MGIARSESVRTLLTLPLAEMKSQMNGTLASVMTVLDIVVRIHERCFEVGKSGASCRYSRHRATNDAAKTQTPGASATCCWILLAIQRGCKGGKGALAGRPSHVFYSQHSVERRYPKRTLFSTRRPRSKPSALETGTVLIPRLS